MTRVLMRCPRLNREIDTGLDIERGSPLTGHGYKNLTCPHCSKVHRFRGLYFDGETQPAKEFMVALEQSPEFAAEVGVLISCSAFIEGYIERLISKITNTDQIYASIIAGMHQSIGSRIDLVEETAKRSNDDKLKEAISILIPKLRWSNLTRNLYAHSEYAIGPQDNFSIRAWRYDAKRKTRQVKKTLDDTSSEVERMKELIIELHSYISEGKMPAPWPDPDL